MVSIKECYDGKYWETGQNDVEVYCLSTDQKPIKGIKNGNKCIELDTKKVYIFSESNSKWYEFT